MFAMPKVMNAETNIITAHFISPLLNGTKKPTKKLVQEKPTGASLIDPFLLFSLIVAKAIIYFNAIKCYHKNIICSTGVILNQNLAASANLHLKKYLNLSPS
jgi:hypothetical protein